MKMTLLIAWRNIWRNTIRSIVTISAVSIGIWALILLLALSQGMISSYVNRAIENRTSHIQLHQPGWVQEKELAYSIDMKEIRPVLDRHERVSRYTGRIVVSGMVQSARSARGVELVGVDPEEEDRVTRISGKISRGAMLKAGDRNSIVIGHAMAERLQLDVGNKVVVSFQDAEGNIATAALKIKGVFSFNDSQYEEKVAFMMQHTLRDLSGLADGRVQEVAILLNDFGKLEQGKSELKGLLPELSVRDYGEISPEVGLYNSSLNLTIGIMTAIVMLALIFGIINTMLMAILERERELGMLRAVGMGRRRVFFMVVGETVMLSLVGLPAGLLLGWVSVELINARGLDLSQWARGLSEFGMSNIIYPELYFQTYIFIAAAILCTSVIASIYPAIKAVSIDPLEAIHRI